MLQGNDLSRASGFIAFPGVVDPARGVALQAVEHHDIKRCAQAQTPGADTPTGKLQSAGFPWVSCFLFIKIDF